MEYEDDRLRFYWQDDILMCDWLAEAGDYEFVDFGIKKRLEITGDKKIVMISDVRFLKFSTREARQRLADKDAAHGVIAVGVVLNSKVQIAIYNFFQAIYKQPTPAKLFSNKEDAIKWIKKYTPKEQ
jgi:hypothetical protein